jgi:hypothetical protein
MESMHVVLASFSMPVMSFLKQNENVTNTATLPTIKETDGQADRVIQRHISNLNWESRLSKLPKAR